MLEAARTHGGRIKTMSDFVDFPIPLGGEWVHTDDGVLDRIVDDSTVDVGIELIPYEQSDPVAFFAGPTEVDRPSRRASSRSPRAFPLGAPCRS